MRKPLLMLLVVVLQTTYAARTSMVIFPLVDKSGDPLYSWIANVIPENFTRKLGAIEGVRVWDPIFMFQTDSTGWNMRSDSLLDVHCRRWEWDAAIGGRYKVVGDTVSFHLRIIWVSGTRQHVGMEIKKSSTLRDCPDLCRELLSQICALLHIELSADDSVRVRQSYEVAPAAYHTYCAGYGFELHRQYAEALTAYNRALELDPSFVLARCRLGRLYSRTGKTDEALSILKKMMKKKDFSPLAAAMTAEFAVDELPSEKAFAYVDRNRETLEQSAAGLTVIGRQYLVAGEYQRATASFRRAIAWGASNLDAEFMLGMSYLMSGEYLVAIDLLNRLIGMRPDYVRYHVLLGTIYRKADRLMESLSVLDIARKKEPKNTMVLVETAHTSFALGWYRKAGQLLEQALRLKPGQHALLADLGIIYWHEKRFDDAQQYLKKAGRRGSGAIASLVNSGNIAFFSGNIPQALSAYRKAEKLGGKDPAIRYNLAMAYLADGNTKKAAYYLDALLAQTPGRVDLLLSRAKLAQQLGNDEDAEMAYRRILENDPLNDVAVAGLVRFLLEQQRYEEAIYRIEAYLESKPARADFMLLLGDAYLAQGWYEVAISRYEQILKDFPEYGAGYLGIGRAMADMLRAGKSEKVDEAIYALKQAGSLLKKNPEPHEIMGDLYMEKKNYRDLAVEQWRKALSLTTDPKSKHRLEKKISDAGRQ